VDKLCISIALKATENSDEEVVIFRIEVHESTPYKNEQTAHDLSTVLQVAYKSA